MDLVEPLLRRTTWLERAVEDLGLGNVSVHRGRAEELAGSLIAPVVTARAVASLDKLVRWSFPLLPAGGRLLALKGEAAARELEEAGQVLRRHRVEDSRLHLLAEGTAAGPVRVVEVVRPSEPEVVQERPQGPQASRGSQGRTGRSRRRRR